MIYLENREIIPKCYETPDERFYEDKNLKREAPIFARLKEGATVQNFQRYWNSSHGKIETL